MQNGLLIVLGLLFVVIMLVMLAQRLRVAYPIFLVIAGLGISFIPGVPVLQLDPDVIFLLFLPPLLYEAAWYTSWNDFWRWKRAIGLLAFGLVFFTSAVVAYATSSFIPGFTLAMGFLLGGIVSPPDAVAAATVLKGVKVPKRILTILEGESLVNDASSLIVFRFAAAAILTGTFSFDHAAGQFFMVTGMGIVVGLAGAHVMYAIHRFLPTTPAIDATLTVMTPYILFLAAEHFHYSGVMAVVSGGLFISYRSHEIFQTGNTRVNMVGVWTTMIFIMNAIVFILIGLELPDIMNGLEGYSLKEAIGYGLAISAIVIALRYLWVFPATYFPRWLFSSISEREASPGWKGPLVVSWAGMRGVVSLATALSIPLLLNDGTPFPHRNLIIFITFVVIFITLVFQGLTLPILLKFIKLEDTDETISPEEEMAAIQMRLNSVSLQRLSEEHSKHVSANELVAFLKRDLENSIAHIQQRINSLECVESEKNAVHTYHKVLLDVYAQQRKELFQIRREKLYSDEEIRKAEMQIDLNEIGITGQAR